MRFEKTPAPVASREATISRISFSSAPLVGREREVAGVSDLLRQTGVRLITITGPGGVGKTRLAQAVADEIAADFPEGLWLVPLAAVRAPELVAGSVARVLGVSEAANRSLLDDIAAFLEQKKALLVLDNFEHLLGSAPLVAELLAKCPLLTCLVTSRALLRVSEEHAYPVPPLRLPPKSDATSVERASSSSAVRLFVMRAQAVQPDFEITTANAAQIEAICRRLDGLPLALELAAARVRHFAAEELAARLVGEERGAALRVLTGGPRDAPSRQQTLHFAIAWSHDLLTPEERVLFRRLAVFVGGFTLEAAEAVVHALDEVPGDVVEGIATLVDQSLLRHDVGPGGVSRYWMLETVREFALEQLVASGEDATAQNAHSAYFLALAEQAAPRLYAEQQQAWLERLQVEHANLREVLARGQQGRDMALALRLAASLWRFWHRRGYWAEGLGWLHRLLTLTAAAEEIDPGARSSALAGAGWLAHYQNDFSTAQDALQKAEESYYRLGMTDGLIEVRHCQALVAQSLGQHQRAAELCEEALTFSRACGDSDMIAESLCNLSRARRELGEYERASALALEALRLRRGERHRSAAHALLVLGDVARDLGETDDARMRGEESLSIFRALGDPLGEGFALHNLAVAAYHDGDLDRARSLCEESLAIFRQGDVRGAATEVMASLGPILDRLGDPTSALSMLTEAVNLAASVGPRWVVAAALEAMARVMTDQAHAAISVELISQAAVIRNSLEVPVRPSRLTEVEETLARGREALGPDAFAVAWRQGQHRPLADLISAAASGRLPGWDDAIEQASAAPSAAKGAGHFVVRQKARHGLTGRELEVLRLLTVGHSNREVGEELFISPATAARHIANIYNKLGVDSRAKATAYAFTHGLLA